MVNNECRFQIKKREQHYLVIANFFSFFLYGIKREIVNLQVVVCKILKTATENKYKLKRAEKTKVKESHFVYKRVSLLR